MEVNLAPTLPDTRLLIGLSSLEEERVLDIRKMIL